MARERYERGGRDAAAGEVKTPGAGGAVAGGDLESQPLRVVAQIAKLTRVEAVASSWYARMLGRGLHDADALIGERVPTVLAAAARRVGLARGVAIWALARRCRALVLRRGEPGAATALFLSAWARRRAVVLLELIVPPPSRSRWRRFARRLWWLAIERPAVRRTLAGGQVLTAAERERCAHLYGIPAHRLQHVPWAWCREGGEVPPGPRTGVLCTGRAACDWETLFAAAAGAGWQLTVACSARELGRVRKLGRASGARILGEVPRDEHERLIRSAAVYVIPLVDRPGSAGQVRLMTATESGTPVVASAVEALEGYAIDGETALLVSPGDAGALRGAVDRLLADGELARRLAGEALERARSWTYRDYFGAVRELIEEAFAGRPLAPRAPSAPPEASRRPQSAGATPGGPGA
jgi:hypothetical protein